MPLNSILSGQHTYDGDSSGGNVVIDSSFISECAIYSSSGTLVFNSQNEINVNYDINKTYTGVDSLKAKVFNDNGYIIFKYGSKLKKCRIVVGSTTILEAEIGGSLGVDGKTHKINFNSDGVFYNAAGSYKKESNSTSIFYTNETILNSSYSNVATKVQIYLEVTSLGGYVSRMSLGYINYLSPTLNSISLDTTNVQKDFYLNGTFNYANLVVTATYQYQVGGDYTSNTITNYSVDSPSMTTKGEQTITVSYNGKTATYKINVHYANLAMYYLDAIDTGIIVRNYKFKQFYDNNDSVTGTITIYYSDATSEEIAITSDMINEYPNFNVAGEYGIPMTVTATKTGESINTTTRIVEVCELKSIAVATNPNKVIYNSGESLVTTGIVVNATFNKISGTTNITDLVSVNSTNATSQVGLKDIELSYNGKTTTFKIAVNGAVEPSVDTSAINNGETAKFFQTTKTLKGYYAALISYLSTIKSLVKLNYKNRVYSAVESSSYTDTDASVNGLDLTYSKYDESIRSGEQNITVSKTINSIELSDTLKITAYNYDSIQVEGIRPVVYYNSDNGGNADDWIIDAEFKVYGVDSSNSNRNELVEAQYTINPAKNTALPVGENNTITFTSTEGVMSGSVNVACREDKAASGATLTASGSLGITPKDNKYYYSVGETINTSNLNLVVSEMASGTHDVTITDSVYTKKLYRVVNNEKVYKDNFTFNDTDTTGAYTLELSFDNLTPVTFDIVLDYVVSVSINTSTSKLTYKAGEKLDLSQIKGTRTFASGNTAEISIGNITPYSYTFAKSDLTNYNSETVELDLTISGVLVEDIEFTVICIKSMSIDIDTEYKIYDKVKINSVSLTYSDDSTETLDSTKYSSIVWDIDDEAVNSQVGLYPSDIRTTNEFTITASYSEGGLTITDTEDIEILALKEIQLMDGDSVVTELKLDYNTIINNDIISIYKIRPKFNDNTTGEKVSISDLFTEEGTNLRNSTIRSKISNSYTVYNWLINGSIKDSLRCTFDIRCNRLASLSLNWGSINSTHYVEDELPINTITNVVATFSALESGEEYNASYITTRNLIYNELSYAFDNSGDIDGFTYKFRNAGNYTLIALYSSNGLTVTTSKSITVENIQLNSILVDYTGTSNFIEEQSITLTDSNLTLTGNYNNGSREIPLDSVNFYEIVNESYVLFNINKRLSITDNDKTIYVEYARFPGVYAELFTIIVTTKTLTDIEIITNPSKTRYTIGDLFSLSGIVVKAIFSNGTTDTINSNLSATLTGYDLTEPFDSTNITQDETKTITISYVYGGVTKTATFEVDFVLPTLSKLRINTTYAKTIFNDGDTFTASGLLVYGVFENGYEEQLETLNTNYTITTTDFASGTTISVPTVENVKQYGLYIIDVTGINPYRQSDTITNDTDYKITILGSAAIKRIYPVVNDNWDSYVVGETFTAKGIHIYAEDGDENRYEVDFSTNPAKNTLFKKAQKITVTAYFDDKQVEVGTISVNTAYSTSLIQSYNYKIAVGDINGNLFTSITHEEATIELGVKENGEITYPIFRDSDVSVDTNIIHEATTYGYNVFNDVMSNAASKCIGYMEMGVQDDYGNVIKNAHIVLFDDPINPIAGDGNVVVKYPHYVEGYSDKINKCTFGIIYNKHLFVSGNSNYRNCDWHTENINVAQVEGYNQIAESDYTYFSDLDYCYYGTDDTKIVGYDIYRDGDLVVIKESSRTQATLYRREAKMITAVDSQGNTLTGYYEDAYPSFDINFNGGDGGLSNRSIINFMGDTLFLTKNGLKVLSSKDTTYNKEKIVYDVSSYINPRILKENLEDGYLFAYKEKLLLKTSRGLYVGEYTLRNDNKEYEWYFLGNIKADLFFEYDDELYFMNNEGGFYKFSFDEKLYKDNSRTFIGVGGALLTNIENDEDGFDIDEINNRIIVSSDYASELEEGKDFNLITVREANNINIESLIHANIGTFIESINKEYLIANDNTFNPKAYTGLIDKEKNTIEIKLFNEINVFDRLNTDIKHDLIDTNKLVYIDLITQNQSVANSPVVDRAYKLVKYNDEVFDYRYKLIDTITNTECNLSEMLVMRLSYIVNNLERTKITDIKNEDSRISFKLLGDHDTVLDLIYYDNRNNKYSAVITSPKNVEAYFITKPYDMGTILYDKTIYQWAIANDTELASYMDVGYLTSIKQGDYDLVINTASGSKSYNYDDNKFSFDKIQFTSDKLPHIYNRFRLLANIGFIRFIFKNLEDSNMVLDKLSLVYTISQSIKGVR